MSDDKKKNKELELEIFNRISRIVKDTFTSLADDHNDGGAKINHLDALYKQPEFNAEKKLLNEINNMGLWKGVVSGLACFAFLRVSPRVISNMLRRRAGVAPPGGVVNPFKTSSGYKFDPPAVGGTMGQQPNLERPGLVFRWFRLSLDTFVSLSIGAYASLYFVDKQKMMKQCEEIPLVEGRSLMSEELCEPFSKEFQKFDPQIFDKQHPSLTGGGHSAIDDGLHDFRNTLQGFVANCRRREIYEEELRREQGLRNSEPVVVPSGGVPRDISVTLDDLLGDRQFGEGSDETRPGNGDDYFDTYFDMDDDKAD